MPSNLRMVGQFYAAPSGEQHRPIFASAFASSRENLLACSDEEGHVSLVNSGDGSFISTVRHNDSIFDVQFSLDDTRLLLASADEFTYVRRVDDLEGSPLLCLGHHQGTVRTARWHPSQPNMLVTAARDGDMAVWDLRSGSGSSPSQSSPVAVYSGIHKRPAGVPCARRSNPDRTTVVQAEFVPLQEHLIATIGQPDHAIKLWDIRYKWRPGSAPTPNEQIRLPFSPGSRERAFTSYVLRPDGTSLYAANANNTVYEYCLSNFSSQPLCTFRAAGYEAGSFFVKLALSPDGQYLASGSVEDRTFIWSTDGASSFKLGGHFKEVTSISWSRDRAGRMALLSCGEDGTMNLWSEDSLLPELPGFGRPTFIPSDHTVPDEANIPSPTAASDSASPWLESLPDHTAFVSEQPVLLQENIRPSTPPNSTSPPSEKSSCKKSVISDFFRPIPPGLVLTDQLLSSYTATPSASRFREPLSDDNGAVGVKRLPGLLNFCSSPLRPSSKQAKRNGI